MSIDTWISSVCGEGGGRCTATNGAVGSAPMHVSSLFCRTFFVILRKLCHFS